MGQQLSTLPVVMAGRSGAYPKIDSGRREKGGPYTTEERDLLVSTFDEMSMESKGDYDGRHQWLPVTTDDLNVRLVMGEEVMKWMLGEDELSNEYWYAEGRPVMLFRRGMADDTFQPENVVGHAIMCMGVTGLPYHIVSSNSHKKVMVDGGPAGRHSLLSKAIVNCLLLSVGRPDLVYTEKKANPKNFIEPFNGTLRGISVMFARR